MASSNMPLKCNICPKKPKFSDISHLLTHVGSKGHLSHYYKTKIQGSADRQARSLLEEYDQWYADWNIDHLMRERINLKDQKNRRLQIHNQQRARHEYQESVSTQSVQTSNDNTSYQASPLNQPFDPRLTDRHVKNEDDFGRNSKIQPMLYDSNYNSYSRQPYNVNIPRTRSFHDSYDASSYAHAELSTLHYGDPTQQSVYRDPITTASNQSRNKSPIKENFTSDDVELPPYPDSLVDEAQRERTTPLLKGTTFPGMSIFDSATPKGRRRRNQKKSGRVLERLEANSLASQAIEEVWTPNWTLKKSKPITGNPSSSSPVLSPSKLSFQRSPLNQLETRHTWYDQAGLRYNSYTDERLEEALVYGLREANSEKRSMEVFKDEIPKTNSIFIPSTNINISEQKVPKRARNTKPTPKRGQLDFDIDDDNDPDWQDGYTRRRSSRLSARRDKNNRRLMGNNSHGLIVHNQNNFTRRLQSSTNSNAQQTYERLGPDAIDSRIDLHDPFAFNSTIANYESIYNPVPRQPLPLHTQCLGFNDDFRRHDLSISLEALGNQNLTSNSTYGSGLLRNTEFVDLPIQPAFNHQQLSRPMLGIQPNIHDMPYPRHPQTYIQAPQRSDWLTMFHHAPQVTSNNSLNEYLHHATHTNPSLLMKHHVSTCRDSDYDSPPSVGNTPPASKRRSRYHRQQRASENYHVRQSSLNQSIIPTNLMDNHDAEVDEERTVTAPASDVQF